MLCPERPRVPRTQWLLGSWFDTEARAVPTTALLAAGGHVPPSRRCSPGIDPAARDRAGLRGRTCSVGHRSWRSGWRTPFAAAPLKAESVNFGPASRRPSTERAVSVTPSTAVAEARRFGEAALVRRRRRASAGARRPRRTQVGARFVAATFDLDRALRGPASKTSPTLVVSAAAGSVRLGRACSGGSASSGASTVIRRLLRAA